VHLQDCRYSIRVTVWLCACTGLLVSITVTVLLWQCTGLLVQHYSNCMTVCIYRTAGTASQKLCDCVHVQDSWYSIRVTVWLCACTGLLVNITVAVFLWQCTGLLAQNYSTLWLCAYTGLLVQHHSNCVTVCMYRTPGTALE